MGASGRIESEQRRPQIAFGGFSILSYFWWNKFRLEQQQQQKKIKKLNKIKKKRIEKKREREREREAGLTTRSDRSSHKKCLIPRSRNNNRVEGCNGLKSFVEKTWKNVIQERELWSRLGDK